MSSPPTFIGIDTTYPTADGGHKTRVHLDGAASPLACSAAHDAIMKFLPHYSNTHSYVHSSAQISTQALAWARSVILKFVNANEADYTAIFSGSGTTAGINRIARGLAAARPERKTVLVSSMEHHANDLPHRQFGNTVIYLPLTGKGENSGAVDLQQFEKLCNTHGDSVNYIAVSSVSNVTGISNPIQEMTEIAHRYFIPILVDAAQEVPHGVTDLEHTGADFLVFSGHKMYAPTAPGVLIARKDVLDVLGGQDLGGGSVDTVSYYDYQLLTDFPEKEESGTPNIVGAVALAAVMNEFLRYGLEDVVQHDQRIMLALINGLAMLPFITVYGDKRLPRTGAVAFNMVGVDHGLLAAILNDYFAIAVRNECFCAHPYVSSLIKESLWDLDLDSIAEADQEAFINMKRGMVRASISLYNNEEQVRYLLEALSTIHRNIDEYRPCYDSKPDGSYQHIDFKFDWRDSLSL